MKKKFWITGMVIGMSLGMMACNNPSDEKIEQVRLKFDELVEAHNKTVEVHKEVADDYLDESLKELTDQVTAVQDCNLAKLTEEEIDVLIEEMSSAIEKYEETIVLLIEKKREEADEVLIEVLLTIHNQTGKELKELYLFSSGQDQGENILDESVPIGIGETLTGLYIYKDVKNTPWKMKLSDGTGRLWEMEIETEDLEENEITLFLKYDSENDAILSSDTTFEENSIDKGQEEL